MKRVAESQLTKDTADDEDDTQEPSTGIQKAEPSSLSDRKIRSLPKRALASATPSATSTPLTIESSNGTTKKSPEPASRFSGFTGFGSSTPSAFTFTSPISQANTNVTHPSQTTATPSGKLLQSAPATQPPKGSSFSPTSNPTPPSTPPSSSDAQAKRDAGHKYYLLVRGLNISILDAIAQAVQADPFVDVAEMLEKYKSLRSSALKEFNDSSSALGSRQTGGAAPSSSKDIPAMPTPPKSFFGFSKDTGTGTTSQSYAAGFTPKLDHPQKEPPSSPLSTKIGTSDKPALFSASQPFIFGNEKSSSPGKQTSTRLATHFGSSALQSPAKDDTGSAESKITPTFDKPSQGQDTLQGKITSPSPFSFKPSAPSVPLTPGFSSFLNPSKSSDIGDIKSNISNPSSPSSGFGFGTGKISSVSNPFSFGKGSIGNPVGFAFGSPPAAPNDAKSLGTTDTTPDSELKAPSDPDTALSTSSQDPSPAPSQGSMYDADGPGEEDEVTLHEVKAHAYKIALNGDKKDWLSVGRGQMKLKERVDVKRRILMRNSNNGQIILNFNLFPGFSIDVNKKVISFCVPGEHETPTVYRLRVPNEADAVNWQKAIQTALDDLLPSQET